MSATNQPPNPPVPEEPQMEPQPQYTAPPPPPPTPVQPSSALPRKSPGLAVVLSCLPGLGHLYLGLYQRGIAFFLAFAAAIFLADNAGLGITIPFVWFFGLIDAYRQAQFINLGYVPEMPTAEAAERVTRKGNLGLGVFLLVIGVILLINQFYPIDFYWLRDWWPAFLVLAGAYLIGRYMLDQKKAQEERRRAEEAEYESSY